MPLLAHTVHSIAINSAAYRLAMPCSADLVLNSIPETKIESELFSPYWAELWPAARALASFLDRLCVPQSWLVGDIGCGLGLCSMILSRHNLHPVAFDISLNAALFARQNIKTLKKTAAVVCCDWRALPFKCRRFNMIVGADLLYEEHQIQTLLCVLDVLLEPKGVAYIADPQRPFWNSFKQAVLDSNHFYSSMVIDTKRVEHSEVEILKIAHC